MEENRLWAHPPADAFEEIMKRLPLKDYLGLRIICRSWKELVSKAIANKNCCHLPELPLVFLQTKDPCFFFSLISKSVHHAKTLLLDHDHICCHGSVEGWLIMSDYSEEGCATFFFLNPVTDVRIIIPSKLYFPYNFPVLDDGILYVTKMVASSKPNSEGSESDCYLVGLMTSFYHIAVYKLFDKSWTIIEPDKDSRICFRDVEIIGTKLFVTDSTSNSILVYELKNSTNGPSKAEMMVKLPQVRPPESRMIGNDSIFIGLPKCYLAKDEVLGELYVIYMYGNMEYNTQDVGFDRSITFSTFVRPTQVTTVEVFKLDMNKYPIGWLNVKLDDKVAFVSSWKSIVMSRDEQNYNKELTTGNSLYFLINVPCPMNPRSGLRLGMFCLTESSTKYFPMKISKFCDVRYPFWFIPSIW